MPNWVSTSLSVKGSPTEVQRFVDGIKDSRILHSYFPCPEELHKTIAGYVGEDGAEEHRKQQESNIAKYGHKDWYDWSYEQWGTKWGDCDTDIGMPVLLTDGTSEVQINYLTAWGPADTGFLKVSTLFPELLFTFDYDEEAGFFAGVHVFRNGAIVFESMYEPCSYKDEVDYDDDESIQKYEDWKEENSDRIFTEYVEFLKGVMA